MVLCAALGFIYPKVTNYRLPFCLDIVLTSIVFYYLGNRFKKYIEKYFVYVERKSRIIFILIITSLWCLTIFFSLVEHGANLNELQYNYFLLFYVVAILGSASLCLLSKKIHRKWILYLGNNSLIIMCIHEPIKRIVIMLVSKLTEFDNYILRENIFGIGVITIMTIIMIIPIITIINKFFPYVLGKKKEKTNGFN